MARYDDSQPYTHDYDEDCAYCGEEFPRGELAWSPSNELECAWCECKRQSRTIKLELIPLHDDYPARVRRTRGEP